MFREGLYEACVTKYSIITKIHRDIHPVPVMYKLTHLVDKVVFEIVFRVPHVLQLPYC